MNKTLKIVWKSVLNVARTLPFILIFFWIWDQYVQHLILKLYSDSLFLEWVSGYSLKEGLWVLLALAYIMSLMTILRQAHKYNSFADLQEVDFLVSNHKIVLPKSSKVIDVLENEVQSVFADVTLTDAQDDYGYRMYDVGNQSFYGAYLKVDFCETTTVLSIKPRWYAYLPDNAKNYNLLQQLKIKIEVEILKSTSNHT